MSCQIAIPTYKRSKTISNMTLRVLREIRTDPKLITLFVADDKEAKDYKREVHRDLYGQIVVGKPTLRAQRNFIQQYYPEGQLLLDIDDDIRGFEFLSSSKSGKLIPLNSENLFNTLLETGFAACTKMKTKLWGLYPVRNHFFMNTKINYGMYFISGVFHGVINSHSEELFITQESKTDYERICRYGTMFGGIIRIDYVTFITRYYKEPGGMQEYRNKEVNEKSSKYLLEHYPHFLKKQTRTGPLDNNTEIEFIKFKLKD